MPDPKVLLEEKDFLAIEKPAGLMVHAARVSSAKRIIDEEKQKQPTLVDWLLSRYPEIKTVGDDPAVRPGIVHRLDKETSGILLVPRTQEYFEYLKSLFKNHEIQKTYLALVFGEVKYKTSVIDAPIGIKSGTLKRSIHSQKMAKPAVTTYRVRAVFAAKEKPFSLLEVMPKTGRTHQIRVHLASIGNPILGDHLYGPRRQPEFASRLMLHAAAIEFRTKAGKSLHIEDAPPEDFETIIEIVEKESE